MQGLRKGLRQELSSCSASADSCWRKPCECNACGKAYCYAVDFVQHIRFHTGENHTSVSSVGRPLSVGLASQSTSSPAGDEPRVPRMQPSPPLHFHPAHQDPRTRRTRFMQGMWKSPLPRLIVHSALRLPAGEKAYECSGRGEAVTYSSAFVRHGSLHTGKRPFGCKEGGKAFCDSSSLVQHVRIHTSKRPYEGKVL